MIPQSPDGQRNSHPGSTGLQYRSDVSFPALVDCQVCGQGVARDHFLSSPIWFQTDIGSQLCLCCCAMWVYPGPLSPGTAFQPTPSLESILARLHKQMGQGSELDTLCSAVVEPHVIWACPCIPGGCPSTSDSVRPMLDLPPLSFCMNVRNSSFSLFIWPKIACRGCGYLRGVWFFIIILFSLWFNRSGGIGTNQDQMPRGQSRVRLCHTRPPHECAAGTATALGGWKSQGGVWGVCAQLITAMHCTAHVPRAYWDRLLFRASPLQPGPVSHLPG